MKKVLVAIMATILLLTTPIFVSASSFEESPHSCAAHECNPEVIITDIPCESISPFGVTICCGQQNVRIRIIETHDNVGHNTQCLVTTVSYRYCATCGARLTEPVTSSRWHTHTMP